MFGVSHSTTGWAPKALRSLTCPCCPVPRDWQMSRPTSCLAELMPARAHLCFCQGCGLVACTSLRSSGSGLPCPAPQLPVDNHTCPSLCTCPSAPSRACPQQEQRPRLNHPPRPRCPSAGPWVTPCWGCHHPGFSPDLHRQLPRFSPRGRGHPPSAPGRPGGTSPHACDSKHR